MASNWKNIAGLLILILMVTSCKSEKKAEKDSEVEKTTTQTEEHPMQVMAYYVPEADYDAEKIPLEKLTHIIFSFSHVIDGKMAFRDEGHDEKLKQLVAQRAKHPKLKIMIACGGWGSGNFSEMAATAEGRALFIESAMAFIKEYDLDGMDMDWEYPTSDEAGIGALPEDKPNFTALMKGLREALDKLDRPQTLSFASAGWKAYYDFIELEKVIPVIDYMNVMTYDQIGGNTPYAGHHTPLGWLKESDMEGYPAHDLVKETKKAWAKMGREWEPGSVENIIDYCIKRGVPKEKLVIGGAFYGRAYKGVPPQGNGLYQPNKGVFVHWLPYVDIREKFESKNGFTRHWDPVAKAPYLYSPTDSIYISYDDAESLALKVDYVRDQKIGGLMFWELGIDTKEDNGLMDAIHLAVTGK